MSEQSNEIENPVLVDAVNETTKENKNIVFDLEGFVKRVGEKFIEKQLFMFPYYCYEARKINLEKQKFFIDIGNPGGWSENRNFKFDYEIPRDLYLFMINLVYKDFWAESNERIWRKFMKRIMQGTDPTELLRAIKIYYGKSLELQKTGEL